MSEKPILTIYCSQLEIETVAGRIAANLDDGPAGWRVEFSTDGHGYVETIVTRETEAGITRWVYAEPLRGGPVTKPSG